MTVLVRFRCVADGCRRVVAEAVRPSPGSLVVRDLGWQVYRNGGYRRTDREQWLPDPRVDAPASPPDPLMLTAEDPVGFGCDQCDSVYRVAQRDIIAKVAEAERRGRPTSMVLGGAQRNR